MWLWLQVEVDTRAPISPEIAAALKAKREKRLLGRKGGSAAEGKGADGDDDDDVEDDEDGEGEGDIDDDDGEFDGGEGDGDADAAVLEAEEAEKSEAASPARTPSKGLTSPSKADDDSDRALPSLADSSAATALRQLQRALRMNTVADEWAESDVWDARLLDGTMTRNAGVTVAQGNIAVRRVQLAAGASILLDFTVPEHDVSFAMTFVPVDGLGDPCGPTKSVETMEKCKGGRVAYTAHKIGERGGGVALGWLGTVGWGGGGVGWGGVGRAVCAVAAYVLGVCVVSSAVQPTVSAGPLPRCVFR